ncbi:MULTISPECIES: peptide-methionine (S)-S-oxide reductase MsrA [Dyella]|uniref:Peptide methionine sulfoxide reductase MsrA n=2 Tax=Dyella TaxID=231454 RepID=A0A4V2NMI7_9GAMM|nr:MULTISPECIES: peptide-methionine (S)-S-oxide reductase MsrA [Dyella]TBR38922.1 peptide-methionine (S)-S-oxide reductase [Dyella terrae]TCI13487.1 peptide-methionine (S)-S-oxide reductase [Dyella soli]
MSVITRYTLRGLAAALTLALLNACSSPAQAADGALPAPRVDDALAATHGEATAVFAGGCFWGVESVFDHVKGVRKAWSGYAGGQASTAHYDAVSDGDTGHAESVKVVYDPAQVTYGQLLQVFFSVATDPTELNRQGPDVGTQYRSAVFYGSDEQKRIATAYIEQLTKAHAFSDPIVTQVVPLQGFYKAEDYHQDYARQHPDQPYILINDAPKVARLKSWFPSMYRAEATVVSVQLH